MDSSFLSKVLISAAVIGFAGLFLRLYNSLVGKPQRLRAALRKQGVSGPKPTLLLGNILEIKKARSAAAKNTTDGAPDSHNCGSFLLPFFEKWRSQFGMEINLLIH